MSALALLADPDLLDRSAAADVRAVTRAGCAETERAAVGLARRVVGSAEWFRLVVSGRTSKNEDRCLLGGVRGTPRAEPQPPDDQASRSDRAPRFRELRYLESIAVN